MLCILDVTNGATIFGNIEPVTPSWYFSANCIINSVDFDLILGFISDVLFSKDGKTGVNALMNPTIGYPDSPMKSIYKISIGII